MKIDISYGSGGKQTTDLINQIFIKHFDNPIINKLEDAAVINLTGPLAFTTDSFVVTPMFFNGGDIGKLAVYGTANDLAMMGAKPKFLTAGFIIEAGTSIDTIEKIAHSMSDAAKQAGIQIVAGDTKVIESRGSAADTDGAPSGGVFINTSGIGEITQSNISISNCQIGDAIILSGNLGEHHAAIMGGRLGIQNNIATDCAPLWGIVEALINAGINIRCMRDVTRGGLGTVLHEVAEHSNCAVKIQETALPITNEVKGFCEILGLDPLYMANEGKLIVVVPPEQADLALSMIKKCKYGENAAIIGEIRTGSSVTLTTALGGERNVNVLYGENFPRIC